MRLLAGESFVDSQKMATGKLSEEEWTKLALASAALSQTDIRVDDNPSITVAEMNAKCRRLDNLGLVLVDYLQLMTGSGYGKGGENRVTVVSEISRALGAIWRNFWASAGIYRTGCPRRTRWDWLPAWHGLA